MLRPESTKATDAGEMEVVVLDTAAAPTTASTTAAAATTTKPPDAPSPPQGLAGRLNDFLHSNIYVYLASYYLYWLAFWVAMPLVGLFTMAGYGIYDLWTAKGYRKPCGPVLITGCSSGFGYGLTMALGALGWKVYACVRKEADMAPFARYPSVTGVLLDVTNEAQVEAAVKRIASENPEGLYALVNNAGFEKYGATEWCGLEHFKAHMEVNFFGHLRVTKACLPLLKKYTRTGAPNAPRIVNVNSTSGLLPGLPMKAGYGASKHAAESWSNSLRQELRPFGIEVTSVNPSWHDTRIAASPRDHLLGLFDALPPVLQAEYGREYVERVAADAFDGRQGFTWRPENVTRVLVWAVTAETYRPQYIVGLDARFINMPFLALPRRLMNKLEDGAPFAQMLPAGARRRV